LLFVFFIVLITSWHLFIFVFIYGSARLWTQGLMFARHSTIWAMPPALVDIYFILKM
jgi:hypothetical protein